MGKKRAFPLSFLCLRNIAWVVSRLKDRLLSRQSALRLMNSRSFRLFDERSSPLKKMIKNCVCYVCILLCYVIEIISTVKSSKHCTTWIEIVNEGYMCAQHVIWWPVRCSTELHGLRWLTLRLHFPLRVYCNRSQIMAQRITNKKYTRRSRVAWLLFFTRCDVFCDLLQYTGMEKCNLFVLYNKNWNILLWCMKKEEQVRWLGIDSICMCVL